MKGKAKVHNFFSLFFFFFFPFCPSFFSLSLAQCSQKGVILFAGCGREAQT
jgi:hypothetical protein